MRGGPSQHDREPAAPAVEGPAAAAWRSALPPAAAQRIARLDVFDEIDSTSDWLLRNAPPPAGRFNVAVAEYQHAGRGRLGRRWSAPPGGALMLSAGWLFPERPRRLSALPLAAGVAARRALRRATGVEVRLKWPNDLLCGEAKLGGILVDSAAAAGGCHVVIGIGINVSMPAEALDAAASGPRRAVDLARVAPDPLPDRPTIAALLLDELAELLVGFAAGASAWLREFAEADSLAGRRVSVHQSGQRWSGVARGIEPDGALIVETTEGTRRRVLSGDVSVRYAP